jgi:alpha-D-ribose 1-methylphosphonate 5-triphosphate synthase subunit PhnH
MTLEIVQSIQKVYRTLVTATSYPGRVCSFSNVITSFCSMGLTLPPALIAVAITLLDQETNFSVIMDQSSATQWAKDVVHLTLSQPVTVDKGSYIFVEPENLTKALNQAKIGTFENPHLGATLVTFSENLPWIPELASQYPFSMESKQVVLQGPGIDLNHIGTFLGPTDWIEERRSKNAEFPLGIDMLFCDSFGNIIALPRTTQITLKENSLWLM